MGGAQRRWRALRCSKLLTECLEQEGEVVKEDRRAASIGGSL